MQAFFKGQAGATVKDAFGDLEPIRPEYRDRDARLRVMDEQGLDGAWLFPTLGVGIEEAWAMTPRRPWWPFSAFNSWLHEDWGFAHRDRIFAAPYLCLMDLDGAIAELERVLERGARVLCVRPGPVRTATGTTSSFAEAFDPFWARVNEAGVTVSLHGGDSGYSAHVAAWEPDTEVEAFFATPLYRALTNNRAITETMLALVFHRLLERHPRVRLASIENGSGVGVPRPQAGRAIGGDDTRLVQRIPDRCDPVPGMGIAVLGGRPGDGGRDDRRRPDAVRIRLTAHRRPRRPEVLPCRVERVAPGDHRPGDGEQRPRADGAALMLLVGMGVLLRQPAARRYRLACQPRGGPVRPDLSPAHPWRRAR